MPPTLENPQSPPPPAAPREVAPALARALSLWNAAVFLSWALLPFVLAATVRWLDGWVHLALVLLGSGLESAYVARRNPKLKARRARVGPGTKRWDLAWNAAFWPLMSAIAVVAGLQRGRLGAALPWWLALVGAALLATGFVLSAWAMGANPFFEATVRIQADVGHTVFEDGPYRFVRHPGYAGLCLWAIGSPLLLRSTWAAAPALVVTLWVALRTGLEDATLRRELRGYEAYTKRTRARLVPGVW